MRLSPLSSRRAGRPRRLLPSRCVAETAAGAANTALIADCVALITAAESLKEGTEPDDIDINWIGVAEGADLPANLDGGGWDEVTVTPLGTAPDLVLRVTAVELADSELTGSLSAEWANLKALEITRPLG